MQKKKAVSLIVLVITIIIMIILAGAIILSLNNAGIINSAGEAVEKTNEAAVKQLADLKWAEAYLDEEITTDMAYRDAVINGLKNDGIDTSSYDIQVTSKGVTVEKLITISELQETHSFEYYSTVSLAIEDANNGTIGENADANKSDAKAGVYVENENITVVLLKDTTEERRIEPSVDMTINLGGKVLSAGDVIGIDVMSGNIIIDGRLSGSTIKIETEGGNVAKAIQQRDNTTCTIKGGTYISSSKGGNTAVIHTLSNTIINDATIIAFETEGTNSRHSNFKNRGGHCI